MKRPLLPVAFCYTVGVLLGNYFHTPPALLFVAAFVTLGLAVLSRPQRCWWLWAALILCGWSNIVWRSEPLSPHDLRVVVGDEARFVTIEGRLTETPTLRQFQRDEAESLRTLAFVEVFRLKIGATEQPGAGRVLVATPGDLGTNYFGGRLVRVTGVLAPPRGPLAEGLFDYRRYLNHLGIHYQLKAGQPQDWQLITPADLSAPLTDRFLRWAKATLARGLPERDQELQLLWAMVLGWRTALTDEVNEPFMRSGTMHIFAISGLHIAMIAGILVTLLRVLQLNRLICGLVAIPLLWFYTAVTGWQSSAIRATIMMTIIIGGWALKRPSDLLNSLAAAGLVILLWQPQQLFQASFQLSFFVVLSIALLLPPLEKLRDRVLRTDPLLPRQLLPWWRRWLETPLRWLTTSLATSLAAWLGSMPLTAYYFHLFSPVTLLANLLIVPLSGAALAASMGSLFCGHWLPSVGELLNHSAWLWMSLMLRLTEWAAGLPGAFVYVSSPPAWAFALFYLSLFGLLGGEFLRLRWRLGLLALCATAAAALGLAAWRQAQDEAFISILPLAGGHAIHAEAPKRANDLLVDCGNTNAFEFVLKPFLRACGVNQVTALALTHGDLQHVGAALQLRREFELRETVTSDVRFRSASYRRIVEEFTRSAQGHRVVARGDRVGDWTVLHPETDERFSQADDGCLVLRSEFRGTGVLLLGDLGRPGQEALLQQTNRLQSDIVVSGIPEQGEPLSDGLLDAISPELIVIADSEFPATKRAGVSLEQRLAKRKISTLYTRKLGAIKLRLSPAGWEALDARGEVLARKSVRE